MKNARAYPSVVMDARGKNRFSSVLDVRSWCVAEKTSNLCSGRLSNLTWFKAASRSDVSRTGVVSESFDQKRRKSLTYHKVANILEECLCKARLKISGVNDVMDSFTD